MGSKSTGTTNQTQTITPDPITDAWRQDVFSRGTDLLNQSPAPYYPGSTIAPMSAGTQQGLTQVQAGANRVGNSALGAQGTLSGVAGGANPYVQPLAAGFGGENGNRYLDSLYDAASRPVIDDVNAQFAKAGRYGPSAAYGAGMTRALGDVSASIYAPAYEAERNRELQGLQSAGSLFATNQGQQLQATALLPSIWSGLMAPGQTQAGIGSIYDQQHQAQIDADRERWDYNNGGGAWDALERYAAMMNGLPNLSTVNTSGTTTQKNNPGLLDIIGVGAKAGSLFI